MPDLNRRQWPAAEPQSLHYKADRSAALNGFLQNALEADVQVKSFKRMNALLQSLGNGKVPRLYGDPVIGLRGVLGDEKQIRYFLVDEVVVAFNVFLIDIQTGSGSKKMLDLVRPLNVLVGLEVMYRLEGTGILNLHFYSFL